MPLIRIAEAFDHPDRVFELKHDGFRALAHVEGHRCTLVSPRSCVQPVDALCTEISHSIRATDPIIDGEIICLAPDGRSKFYDLMFRREWPHFVAFDVLAIDGEACGRDRCSSASADCGRSCREWRHGCCCITITSPPGRRPV